MDVLSQLLFGQPGLMPSGDRVAPTCVVTTDEVEPVTEPFLIVMTFSEPVYGLTLDGISVSDGVDVLEGLVSDLTGSGEIWGATVTPPDPEVEESTLYIQVVSGAAQDAAGNDNATSNLLGVPRGAGGVETPVPLLLPGLGLWVDANYTAGHYQDAGITPATADGDPVGRTGRVVGNLANQSDAAKKPALKLAIQNGKSVLRFDSGDVLGLSDVSLLRNAASATVLAVVSYPENTGGHWVLNYCTGASTASRLVIGVNMTVGAYETGGRRLDADTFASVNSGTFNVGMILHTAQFDFANSNLSQYINGVLSGATTTFQTDGNTSDTDSTAAWIGGSSSLPAKPLTGDLAELLVYVPALSDSDRQAAEAYLIDKWFT